ncbi:MAG: VOC family protein [Ancrocorticia sp.]|uniref:VOC family protein n=1 Tax=Ancrocorticia sp. TaxID=2593684 RepID=UPI003F924A2E
MTHGTSVIPPLLDHIVVATPTLEATVNEFERATGIRPEKGGSHESLGTRNYLVTFGGGHYLEIVGVDESLPHPDGPYPFGLDELPQAAVSTWAIHPDDADAAVAKAAEAGIDVGSLDALSRRTPDGNLLEWRLTPPSAGALPFIIDWQDSVSPAYSTAAKADLHGFYLSGDDVPQVRMQLAAMGTAIEIQTASTEDCPSCSTAARLCLEVSGPAGIWSI